MKIIILLLSLLITNGVHAFGITTCEKFLDQRRAKKDDINSIQLLIARTAKDFYALGRMTEIDSQGGDAVKSVAFNLMNEEVPTLNQILHMVEKKCADDPVNKARNKLWRGV